MPYGMPGYGGIIAMSTGSIAGGSSLGVSLGGALQAASRRATAGGGVRILRMRFSCCEALTLRAISDGRQRQNSVQQLLHIKGNPRCVPSMRACGHLIFRVRRFRWTDAFPAAYRLPVLREGLVSGRS